MKAVFYYAIPSQVLILFSMSFILPIVSEWLLKYPKVTEENQSASEKRHQLSLQLLNKSEEVQEV